MNEHSTMGGQPTGQPTGQEESPEHSYMARPPRLPGEPIGAIMEELLEEVPRVNFLLLLSGGGLVLLGIAGMVLGRILAFFHGSAS